jgi:hypothetical protein
MLQVKDLMWSFWLIEQFWHQHTGILGVPANRNTRETQYILAKSVENVHVDFSKKKALSFTFEKDVVSQKKRDSKTIEIFHSTREEPAPTKSKKKLFLSVR